jgi:signal transduction histidine kinase
MAQDIHSLELKKMNDRSRIRNSIFTKLLLIIFISGLLVQIAVILFFGYHFLPKIRGPLQVNLQHYCEMLAQNIGSPPDTLEAKQIAQKYFLTIEYVSNRVQWKSNEKISSYSPVRRFFESETFVVVNNSDGSKFIFSGNFQQFGGSQPWKIIPLLAGIMIILLLAYIMIRLLLQPIKALDVGVKQVAHGNLDYRIETTRKDELGNLTRSYNEMTQKIKEMLHARDHLLRNVSHELRSPLTRMRVALEFLKPKKTVASLSADIRDMEYLIQEILETEKLKNDFGKIALEIHDIVELVRSFTETCKKRKPGLKLMHIPQKIMVNVDIERIKLVLKNVIENAFKYSDKNSHAVEVNIESGNRVVQIIISDDGIGIPSEEIPYVFEPFYRIDRSRSKKIGGYGLGLSICKTIIQAHGGTISITNNRPRGVTVIIELPLV